jgi:predicted RNA-binding protein with PUA-like domain/uncharacterized protein YciI
MLFAFVCKDKPGHLNVRMDTRPEHVEHLNTLNAAGTLKMAGPFLDPEGKPCGSLVIVEADTIEAATAIADSRPLHQGRPVRERRGQALQLGLQQAGGVSVAHWLYKSEPAAWSWEQQKAAGEKGTEWTGVRNYLARNNMRAMQIGDKGFFYHSNDGLEIVGIVEVCALSHPDSTANGDPKWDCVDIRAVCDVPKPVTLKDVKASEMLAKMSLVTSMRLSVQPVTDEEWLEVCRMGGLDNPPR